MTTGEMDRRSEAAKEAIRVVKKFPSVERDTASLMLLREIGLLILRVQEETAKRCVELIYKNWDAVPEIRREFGLEG